MIDIQLRKLRLEKKLTQAEVAEALGLQAKTYSTYECGTREPSAMIICKIALLYNVSADYILGRTECRTITSEKKSFEFSDHEKKVIEAYRKSSNDLKDGIDRMLGIEQVFTDVQAKKIV